MGNDPSEYCPAGRWTLPVGGGVGRLWRVGKVALPVNTQIVPYETAISPDFGPDGAAKGPPARARLER